MLTIRGRILDTIDVAVVAFSKYQSHHLGDEYFATALDQMCKVARLMLVFGSSLETAALICRVLVGDAFALSHDMKDGDVTENQAFHVWSWLHGQIANINEDVKASLDKRADSWMLASFDAEFLEAVPQFYHDFPGKEQEAGGRFSRAVNIQGRSVFMTAKTRMCNVPDIAKKKDVIAAFEGGNLLYALRPAGERYQFVGTAYVEGLMNGEAYVGVDIDQADSDIVLI